MTTRSEQHVWEGSDQAPGASQLNEVAVPPDYSLRARSTSSGRIRARYPHRGIDAQNTSTQTTTAPVNAQSALSPLTTVIQKNAAPPDRTAARNGWRTANFCHLVSGPVSHGFSARTAHRLLPGASRRRRRRADARSGRSAPSASPAESKPGRGCPPRSCDRSSRHHWACTRMPSAVTSRNTTRTKQLRIFFTPKPFSCQH